jgi:hypothetical protein
MYRLSACGVKKIQNPPEENRGGEKAGFCGRNRISTTELAEERGGRDWGARRAEFGSNICWLWLGLGDGRSELGGESSQERERWRREE